MSIAQEGLSLAPRLMDLYTFYQPLPSIICSSIEEDEGHDEGQVTK